MWKRFEIGPHYDLWMRGARFGTLVDVTRARKGEHAGREIAHIRLDMTGKVHRFWLDECRPV